VKEANVARRKGAAKRERDGAETRKWRQALREQYPVIFAFGEGKIPPLTHEQAIAATPEERIRSVWPFLVKSVLKFADTLRPRDLANYDPEDVLTELYIALMEKDCKWEPERGRYLTFCGKVVENELHAIRDRAHTVHSPRNSSCRLKQYEAADAEGNLSGRKAKTYADIRRVIGEHEALDGDAMIPASAPDTAEVVDRRESLRVVNSGVMAGLRVLAPDEATTIGKAFGLFGHPDQPLATIAMKQGRTIDSVKKTKGRALEKIRARLLALQHPASKAG
jgi:hypothetical protein